MFKIQSMQSMCPANDGIEAMELFSLLCDSFREHKFSFLMMSTMYSKLADILRVEILIRCKFILKLAIETFLKQNVLFERNWNP